MTPPGRGQFGQKGLDLQDLCTGPLNIATWFQRIFFFLFFCFYHYKSMGANDPRVVVSLDHWGLTGNFMYETTKHCCILN